MTWFKVDDSFYRHRKVRKLGRDKVAAVGLWTLCGDWSADNLSDGFVPWEIVEDWDPTRAAAARLVDVGLWEDATEDDEDGVRFHDWADHQPTRTQVLAERQYNARKAALYRDPELLALVRKRDRDRCRYCGMKVNWKDRRSAAGATYDHVEADGRNTPENLVVACRSCNSRKGGRPLAEIGMLLLPPGAMAQPPGAAQVKGPEPTKPDVDQVTTETYLDTNQNNTRTFQVPDPTRPDPTRRVLTNPSKTKTSSSSSSEIADDASAEATPTELALPEPLREDVERLCAHVADRVEGNTGKRPRVTARWRTAARLLLDTDLAGEGDPLAVAIRAADWAADDEFWRANVLGVPKLREKFQTLRLQARRDWERTNGRHLASVNGRHVAGGHRPSTTDQRVAQALSFLDPDGD